MSKESKHNPIETEAEPIPAQPAARPGLADLLRQAWKVYRKRPLHYSAATIGAFALMGAMQFLLATTFGVWTTQGEDVAVQRAMFESIILFTDNWFLWGLYVVLLTELSKPYASGLWQLVFSSETHSRGMLLLVVYTLATLGGIVLLVVPGLVIATRYMFAPYVFFGNTDDMYAAFQESARITRGHFWHVVLVTLGLLFVAASGLLLLGVGIAVTFPLALLGHLALFHSLRSLPKSEEATPGLFEVNVKVIVVCGALIGATVYLVSFFLPDNLYQLDTIQEQEELEDALQVA